MFVTYKLLSDLKIMLYKLNTSLYAALFVIPRVSKKKEWDAETSSYQAPLLWNHPFWIQEKDYKD